MLSIVSLTCLFNLLVYPIYGHFIIMFHRLAAALVLFFPEKETSWRQQSSKFVAVLVLQCSGISSIFNLCVFNKSFMPLEFIVFKCSFNVAVCINHTLLCRHISLSILLFSHNKSASFTVPNSPFNIFE